MTAGIDSMILIWGQTSKGARRGNPRQADLDDMRRRSLILLEVLEEQKETIVVPTVTVAELLLGVDTALHGNYIAELQKRFFCPPFDLHAAALAAELWLHNRTLPKAEQLQRTTLRADAMIIATAKVAGATVFYSHDAKCRKLAEKAGMLARDLPVNHPDMFRDAEIRGGSGTSSSPP